MQTRVNKVMTRRRSSRFRPDGACQGPRRGHPWVQGDCRAKIARARVRLTPGLPSLITVLTISGTLSRLHHCFENYTLVPHRPSRPCLSVFLQPTAAPGDRLHALHCLRQKISSFTVSSCLSSPNLLQTPSTNFGGG